MTRHASSIRGLPILLGIACCASLICAAHEARGQDPFGAGAAPAAGGEQPEATIEKAPGYDDPRVQALLATNPQTPKDLLNATLLLVDLGRPQVAKFLFLRLQDSVTDEEQAAALGRSAGIATINRLGEVKEFAPQGAEFVKRVVAATNQANRDPARLAELIERLKQPNVQAQAGAVVALRSGGDAAAQALLDVLLDPARQAEHKTVAAALAGIGGEGVGPLTALATNGSEAQRLLALDSLGFVDADAAERGVVEAPLYLGAFVASNSAVIRKTAEGAIGRRRGELPKPLEAAAEIYLNAKHAYFTKPLDIGSNEGVAVWRWDATAGKPVRVPVTRQAEALERTALLASAAAELSGDATARRLARAASLEAGLASATTAKPPVEEVRIKAMNDWLAVEKPSVPELEGLLEFAIANERSAAAIALVRALAVTSKYAALSSTDGKPAPLVRAVQAADRRVRFAALEEILKLKPVKPFAGSSAVSDALGYFAASTGARKALVVDAHSSRGRDVAGVVGALGYQAEAVPDARTAMRLATTDPDYELLLMYRPLAEPAGGQLLAQLRSDYRTKQLPVAVYCEPDDVERMRSTLRNDPLAVGIHQPRKLDALQFQLADLEAAAVQATVPVTERVRQTQAALTAMAGLADAPSKVFNIRQYEAPLLTAAWNPAIGKQALGVLGVLGSPAAQRTLADVASASALPLDLRQEAAKWFCESVIRFGTLLTSTEVLRQYDRYNASEALDRPTQELLAAILDAIEARAAKIPGGVKKAPPTPVAAGATPLAPPEPVPAAPATPAAAPASSDPFGTPPAAPATPAPPADPFGAPPAAAPPATP